MNSICFRLCVPALRPRDLAIEDASSKIPESVRIWNFGSSSELPVSETGSPLLAGTPRTPHELRKQRSRLRDAPAILHLHTSAPISLLEKHQES